MPRRGGYGRWGMSRTRVPLLSAMVIGLASVVVLMLLTVAVHRGIGFHFDLRVLRDFRRHRSPLVIDTSRMLADLGSIGSLILLAAVVGTLLRWRGLHPILCAAPLACLLVAGACVEVLKVATARVGPHAQFRFGNHGTGSFPSGHSADTTALCIGLAIVVVAALVRRPAERVAVFGAAAAVSVAVGVSRLVLGVHWPTDVVAGWALGLAAAVTVATIAVLVTPEHERQRVRP
jgi:undecaprenyl-diphosphatase